MMARCVAHYYHEAEFGLVQCDLQADERTAHVQDHQWSSPAGQVVIWTEDLAVYLKRERCRAFHAQKGIRCEHAHDGHADWHNAMEPGSVIRLHWNEQMSVRPGPVANPDRIRARDRQVGGAHYADHKIQVWDVWDEYDLDRYTAMAVKYILRAGSKGSRAEDLEKARHCLDKAIEVERGER